MTHLEQLKAAREALADVFAQIDENWLVRNTSDDGEPGWGMRQLPIVMRLAKARKALEDATHLAAATNYSLPV